MAYLINNDSIKLFWAGWRNWGLFWGQVYNETYTTLNSKGYFCVELGPLHFYYYPKV